MANYLDETGLARVWGKVKGLFTKSNVETALGYTINKSVPSDAAFTDANVTQTATDGSSNAEYEILFSGTADNTTRTEGTKKTSRFTFNPQTNQVTAGHFTAESTSPSGTSTATLQGNDVKLGGTSNTWDGTNTSLKTTISGIKQSLSNLGTFYTYSWTAGSSNAYGQQLTQKMTLPKGVYILIGVSPVISVTECAIALTSNKTMNTPFVFDIVRTRTPLAYTFEINEDNTDVWIMSGGSASITYTAIGDASGRIIRVG